jgi:hypothetical protein
MIFPVIAIFYLYIRSYYIIPIYAKVSISNKPLKIQAEFKLERGGGGYSNTMNFSTGVLHFQRNYKEKENNVNATQVTAYQYFS